MHPLHTKSRVPFCPGKACLSPRGVQLPVSCSWSYCSCQQPSLWLAADSTRFKAEIAVSRCSPLEGRSNAAHSLHGIF